LHSRLHMDSLYRVAMLHSCMGLWPAAEHGVEILAEAPCAAGALGTEDDCGTAMCNTTEVGRSSMTDAGTVPDLADCPEYTGQSVHLERMRDVLHNRDLEDSLAVMMPLQININIPLPIPVPNQMYGIVQSLLAIATGESCQRSRTLDIRRLRTRLCQLPRKIARFPIISTAIGVHLRSMQQGSGRTSASEAAHTNQRLHGDAFTIRQQVQHINQVPIRM